jgi:hypothetical protein
MFREAVEMVNTTSIHRPWNEREKQILDRYARAVVAGRYRRIDDADREMLAELRHLRLRNPTEPFYLYLYL